jgi:hypothetical protein
LDADLGRGRGTYSQGRGNAFLETGPVFGVIAVGPFIQTGIQTEEICEVLENLVSWLLWYTPWKEISFGGSKMAGILMYYFVF